MEHRWGQRSQVEVDIRIYAANWPTSRRGNLQDVSASGALIETESNLTPLQCIEVELALRARNGIEIIRIPACVVRKADRGAGIEWCESLPIAVDSLVARAIHVTGHRAAGPCDLDPGRVPTWRPTDFKLDASPSGP